MSTKALLRFLLHVDDSKLGQIASSYAQAAEASGVGVAALPLVSGRFLPDSPWNALAPLFQRETGDRYINIVIGQGDAFSRGWTLGVPNVAVLVPPLHFMNNTDRKALFRYDDVLVPTLEILQHPWAKHYGFDVPAEALVPPSKLIGFLKKYRLYLRGEVEWRRSLSAEEQLDEKRKAEAFAAQYVDASKDPSTEEAMKILLSADMPMSGGGEAIE